MSSGESARETRRTRSTTAAGLCYLAVIAGGLFAEGVARGSLVVPGDAAATARAISENETLWRLGLAVHLLYLVPALALVVSPGFWKLINPAVLLPILLAELSRALWLLGKGIAVEAGDSLT